MSGTSWQKRDSFKSIERLKKIAKLYDKLLEEFRDKVQESYDNLIPLFKSQPPIDRTVPLEKNLDGEGIEIIIDEELDVGDRILPAQTVEEIINKFDDIAVGNCFCRVYRKLLGHSCKFNAPMEVCFTFGKSARHVIQQGFGRKISKDEALEILKKAEDAGLVHKAFHNRSDIFADENSICNCCSDCCDTFQLWRSGALPLVNSTSHLSVVNPEKCVGCGTCEDRCPVDAITVNDDTGKAKVNEDHCIGCGVCAHFCPENAITLKKSLRTVFIPPPRLKS
ncbi:MAG: 4Fe-4S binding protein [Promethearchaeota archaeon]